MSTYDVTAHESLSPAAVAVRGPDPAEPSPAFGALARQAERVLGLAGTAFAGEPGEDARLAVALQVNYQVDTGDGRAKRSETRGERRVDYADDGGVHPQAKVIADRLLASLAPAAPPAARRAYGTGAVRARTAW